MPEGGTRMWGLAYTGYKQGWRAIEGPCAAGTVAG